MKILVAGATGKTGLRLVRELGLRGHDPVALVRESSDTSGLPEGTEQRLGDLTDLREDACAGCDAVVFAAGSGGDTGADMTEKVDRKGAERLIDLAAKSGVKRFVMLSSIGTENPPKDGEMAHYLQAKHEADEHLRASGLDYAIVRPVSLIEADGNRNIRYGRDVDPEGKAARGDVAFVLANAVDGADWLGKTATMESV